MVLAHLNNSKIQSIICILKIQNIICILHEYEDNHNTLAIEHVRDTDSNKSSDFLLNPLLYNAYIYYYCVALQVFMYSTNEIKFKLNNSLYRFIRSMLCNIRNIILYVS